MARLPLLLWPNLALRQKSTLLTQEDVQGEDFKERLKSLHETLLHFRGVGISAIQVNWPVRLFAMRTKDEVQTFINPRILETDGELDLKEEGCLSLPGIFERVERYSNVIIESMDPDTGMFDRWDLDGIEAQCAQHEIEHMDGVMKMVDRAGAVKRDVLKRKVRKQLRINPLYNGEL